MLTKITPKAQNARSLLKSLQKQTRGTGAICSLYVASELPELLHPSIEKWIKDALMRFAITTDEATLMRTYVLPVVGKSLRNEFTEQKANRLFWRIKTHLSSSQLSQADILRLKVLWMAMIQDLCSGAPITTSAESSQF